MQVRRDIFLKRLIARRRNGMVKVITGLRRCGKSYLLGVLYKDYLLSDGVGQDHIIEVALDEPGNYKYVVYGWPLQLFLYRKLLQK